MVSDRQIISYVRKRLGVQPDIVSDGDIVDEIERGKQEINREYQEYTSGNQDVGIYVYNDNAERALKSYVTFRVKGYQFNHGKVGKEDDKGIPKTVSEIRRKSLPDLSMLQLRDETLRHMEDIRDG